jgi:Ner family transcriptional regulator
MENYVSESPDDQSAEAATKPDWHPADVLAGLKKRGYSLSGLSVAHGYHPTAAGKALKRSWPALEVIIAAALVLTPQDIWPNRYDGDGRPRSRTKI